ncbi:septum formation inhibitor Maf [Caldichromatium japonicum]|uniref:dTTP/UTP pyrophosphatase n=1 Tax=Caldichromatium japonicum TaxID=2699430 RepID=A0A6G7VF49_9GAMM|nr:nucleoside triphosphate pyrophosphatase [Caldichromatium japonicum]QIK38669.1 septum formation inhibitor Maf [Caldichromatium japonicum]
MNTAERAALCTDVPPQLYLASRSPRRAELLRQIGVRFVPIETRVDEGQWPGEMAEDYVRRLALAKAQAGRARIEPSDPRPVLGADTAVIIGTEILGKPHDWPDFQRMMGLLAGNTHRVLTGVALAGLQETWYALSTSQVSLRAIAPDEQWAYWQSGEPRDKAGGYAIQGLGALFVADLQGSYSGVMGLPLYETGRLLQQAGLTLLNSDVISNPIPLGPES